MHHLSTENILLKMENVGLKKTFENEKKRCQRGRPLQFKIQLLRVLAKASKEEEKLRPQQAKEEKQQKLQERNHMRASARQARLQEA
ncbi:hypothetical protein EYZ11_010579 [Aspergillus tanneri]|uniref:Uncharacterized protein n=1 Tax=Aspergillus tanneri TaxID=1220188 RepID=A0A4S3JAD3_9EURO|nr:hypothetical protein EYZ11_010579 [Aspergillus tanneri]